MALLRRHKSENSRKLYVADLAKDVHCNFLPEALMNTIFSYEAAYWLERISYNFLICTRVNLYEIPVDGGGFKSDDVYSVPWSPRALYNNDSLSRIIKKLVEE